MPPILLLAALAILTATAPAQPSAALADTRDGKSYRTVKIGEQVWMAENLNYNAQNSKCYKDDPANCEKYGRLYDWETAMKVCPKGWHLPDTIEWNVLVDFAGGERVAGKKLKTANGWNDYGGKPGNGEDKFGFSALPGGYGTLGGDFDYIGNYGSWWSAYENSTNDAYLRSMYYDYENTDWYYSYKTYLYSVRCVKN